MKIAVIYSGCIRNHPMESIDSHKKFIRYDGQEVDIDFYASTWDIKGNVLGKNYSPDPNKSYVTLDKVSEEELTKLSKNLKAFKLSSFESKKDEFAEKAEIAVNKLNPNPKRLTYYLNGVFSQYYSVKESFEFFSLNKDEEYDYIIKSRFDNIIETPIELSKLDINNFIYSLCKKSKVIKLATDGTWLSDIFFIGNYKSIGILCYLYDNLEKTHDWIMKNIPPIPYRDSCEFTTINYLKNNGLKVIGLDNRFSNIFLIR